MLDPISENLAVDVLHDDEDTVVFFADFVDGADVGMVQCRGGLGLVDEPLARVIAPPGLLAQHLDGDLAAQGRVFCEEDVTHPARAQFPNDSVMADF
jgi:hypothetical protein